MRHNCCHFSFASTLKILNFVQAFFGVSIIIYSIWMLDQYNRHVPVDPPPSPPTAYLPDSSSSGIEISEPLNNPIGFVASIVLGSDGDHGFSLRSLDLPAPWVSVSFVQIRMDLRVKLTQMFIYSFMGVGILVCIVTMIGFIAAEAINGCCLCFYSILKTLLILLEAALVAYIAIDRHWEKDLPYDPTGELNSLRAFIEENIGICKWVGVAVLAVQLLSLLLALVLRAMVSTPTPDPDDEEDYENPRNRARDPLLGSQASAGNENWSSRIRERYGLNQAQAVNRKADETLRNVL